ncbi:MAG: ABC transporter permease [Fibrobacterales bacterium]
MHISPTIKYFINRGLWYLATFVIVTIITFILPRLGENDPIDTLITKSTANMEINAAREKEEAYLVEFGVVKTKMEVDAQTGLLREVALRDADNAVIRKGMVEQFFDYFTMIMSGDLGTSIAKYPKPVLDILSDSIPWTIAIQLPTILLGWLVGNALGALAAYKRGIFDNLFYPLAQFSSSIPAFSFAILLVFIFGIELEWFPAIGAYSDAITPSFSWIFIKNAAAHYTLPFLSVFLAMVGGQAIGMRSMSIYELGTDYIRYSKQLGIPEYKIIYYMFRNAILPQLTGLAIALGVMIAGAVLVEMIFSYPGVGLALLNATKSFDTPVIQASALIITSAVLIANYTVDILLGILDPRIKAGI